MGTREVRAICEKNRGGERGSSKESRIRAAEYKWLGREIRKWKARISVTWTEGKRGGPRDIRGIKEIF